MIKFKIGIFVAVIFFIIKLITISDYGINWDEVNRDYKGQAYIHYFLTGSKDYHNLSVPRRSFYQKDNYSFAVINTWVGHPPLGDILSSFSNYIFYQQLGILGDIEAYHLFYIVICSVLVGFIFYFTAVEYGIFTGIIATLTLVLYPLFFGESSFNFKDPVQASFYAMAVVLFYKAFLKNSWKLILISAVAAGFALGVKFNILFAVFTFIPWLIILHWKKMKKFVWPFSLKMSMSFLLVPVISFGIVIASWPYLWQNPLRNLLNVFNFYQVNGTFYYQPIKYLTIGNISTFPVQWILFTTPIIVLIFSLIGVIYSVRFGYKEKSKLSLLILFWFLVPILRVTAPHTGVANGIREIMEYIPPMAILAGLGANYIASQVSSILYQVLRIKSSFRKSFILYTLYFIFILSFLPIALKLISLHPNENLYFNFLIGGHKGARDNGLPGWGNSFGNAYKQAAIWINNNAEKNAKVDLAMGYKGSMPSIWLRKDIIFSNKFRQDINPKGEYIIETTGENSVWPQYCYWVYARNFLNPVYQLRVDGVSILAIWKNDKDRIKNPEKIQTVLNGCVQRDRQDSDR